MKQRNISRWYVLGLTALVVVGCLFLAVGSTWARYRTDYSGNVTIAAGKPVNALVGTWDDETGKFTESSELLWTEEDGTMNLAFAVSNNSVGEDCTVRVRLIVSLGAWSEDFDAKSVVISDGTESKYTMEPLRIVKNSAMYYTFGDGWMFRFLDEDGEEACWTLEGGKLTCKEFGITIDSSVLTDISLVQLQIDTDFVN